MHFGGQIMNLIQILQTIDFYFGMEMDLEVIQMLKIVVYQSAA